MYKQAPIILTLSLLLATTVPVMGGETVSLRYEFSNGGSVDGEGNSVVWDPCWDIKEDGDAASTLEENGGPNTGFVGDAACEPFGGRFNLGGLQGVDVAVDTTDIIVSIQDDNTDSTAFLATTSDRFDGNGDENTESFGGCGSAQWVGEALPFMQVWVYTVVVDSDTLEPCLGSAGFVTAVFS